MNKRNQILRTLSLGLIACAVAGWCFARHGQASAGNTDSRARALPQPHSDSDRSTLRFEHNIGQSDPRVRYLARGNGYALYLTAEDATLSLSRLKHDRSKHDRRILNSNDLEQAVLSMRVVGARSVEPAPGGELSGRSNYLMGADPNAWQTDLSTYASVLYDHVLPGVSMVYYGNSSRELEYDFIVDPGADPNSIELEFEGVSALRIDADGSAVLTLAGGAELRKAAPIAYQTNALGQRVTISAQYELRAGNRLELAVGAYDGTRELRIDPALLYSTYMGGSSFDQAYGVASDAAGNSYITGYTSSALFPTIAPLQESLAGGVYDVFICKFSPNGSIVYSTFLGGKGADVGYAIAADATGNAYVSGVTFSSDFPTVSPFQATPGGKEDAFVAKLNPQGSALLYSTYLGGSEDDFAQGIAVSSSGNAFLIGSTFSANFPKAAAIQPTLNGISDAFVTNIAPSGASLVYSTYLGGSAAEDGHAIAVDANGNAYAVGSTASTNFPLANALQPTPGGGSSDAFVTKLNGAGSALAYSTYLGGNFSDEALGVAVHSSGSATVTGYTTATNFPTRDAQQSNLGSAGHSDAFVSRLSAAGNALTFSTYLGGSGDERGTGVGVDSLNSAYVVGNTDSSDFPLQKPLANQSVYNGGVDAFVTTIDPTGSPFIYSTYLGGSAEDRAAGVSVQTSGITHVVGNTLSANFPVLLAPISSPVGAQDSFLTRLPGVALNPVPAASPYDAIFLSGLLLGAGLWGASLRRKRLA